MRMSVSAVSHLAMTVAQKPRLVIGLNHRVRKVGKFAVADPPFSVLPLFLTVFVPRQLVFALTVVLEEQLSVPLPALGRLDVFSSPLAVGLYSLEDAYGNRARIV